MWLFYVTIERQPKVVLKALHGHLYGTFFVAQKKEGKISFSAGVEEWHHKRK